MESCYACCDCLRDLLTEASSALSVAFPQILQIGAANSRLGIWYMASKKNIYIESRCFTMSEALYLCAKENELSGKEFKVTFRHSGGLYDVTPHMHLWIDERDLLEGVAAAPWDPSALRFLRKGMEMLHSTSIRMSVATQPPVATAEEFRDIGREAKESAREIVMPSTPLSRLLLPQEHLPSHF